MIFDMTKRAGGGGDPNPTADGTKDVIFIDYDGTVRYSYSTAEFLALTALPANPTHTDMGLTAEGWNWTLAGAQAYVTKYKRLEIGQTYTTTSGATEIDIVLQKGRLSPTVGIGLNGTVSIDWGDSTTPDTVTGTNKNTVLYTLHTYSAPGSYTIKISRTSGTYYIMGDNTKGSWLICKDSSATEVQNYPYRDAVKAVRFGSNCEINGNYNLKYMGIKYATIPRSMAVTGSGHAAAFFKGCMGVNTVVYPYGWTTGFNIFSDETQVFSVSLPETSTATDFGYAFRSNSRLSRLSIPDSATKFGIATVSNCNGLTILYIPQGVTQILSQFYLNGLKELHFTSATPPTLDAAYSLPTDCTIYVPTGKLTAYTTADNYPDPNTYTYVEE